MTGFTPKIRRDLRRTPSGIWVFALVLALALTVRPAAAEINRDGLPLPAEGARSTFELIRESWETGDQQALANLVHHDGLRVQTGGAHRSTEYSPSQSFYYFKNLFQSLTTVDFQFERMEETSVGERVHAMAIWRSLRGESDRVTEQKFVFVLSRQDALWRLTEITTIR